jgi:hypothetical protein
VARLEAQRAAALAAGRAGHAGLELLDDLAQLEARLAVLDPDEVGGAQYEERTERITPRERPRNYTSRAGHMGLSRTPRPTYLELPLATDPEATLRQVKPRVLELRDELTVLGHQLETYAARGADRMILMLELVGGGEWALRDLYGVASAGLNPLSVWVEYLGEDGRHVWEKTDFDNLGFRRRARRLAVVHESAGLREIAAGLAGWALVSDATVRRFLVGIVAIAGSGVDDIAAFDARRAGDRQARRAAAHHEPLPAEVITFRGLRHVASGHERVDAVHAAILRSRS